MLKRRAGNLQEFDELDVRVFAGEGKYTMYDEVGSIDFTMTKDGAGYRLNIAPSEDCITKSVKIIANDGYAVSGEPTVALEGKPVAVYLKKQQ